MDNLILVIFGASGDLTARKLIPAIFDLYRRELLPECFAVLGVSRSTLSDEDFRKKVVLESDFVKNKAEDLELTDFASKLYYQSV